MVKVISLSDEAYRKLKVLKMGRSFSEVVVALIENKKLKRKRLNEFVGIWAEDKEYWNNFKKEIRRSRNKSKMKEVGQ
ncbi:MAG: antitoxin VapB family protein [Candidatus Pacearchaeota archaeon]|nr:antitoxin VapB family protein [Candidatus Pacearchaeota archaeon]